MTLKEIKIENKASESNFNIAELNLYPMDKDKKAFAHSHKKEQII